jgi:hypothetical protein
LEAFDGSRETCDGSCAVRVTSDVSDLVERNELGHHAEQHRVACVAAAQLVSVARHISDPDVTCTLRESSYTCNSSDIHQMNLLVVFFGHC